MMHGISFLNGRLLARIAALAAGVLALAGCVANYSLVQAEAAGTGSYYTSEGYYPAPNDYYDGDVDIYAPFDAGFGYDGIYGLSSTFGLGLGSPCGWSCADYFDGWLWYYGGVGYHGRKRRHGHPHHADPVASGHSHHPWLQPDPSRVAGSLETGITRPPIAVPARPMAGLVNARTLESASFVPRHNDRTPQSGLAVRAYMAPQPPAPISRPSAAHDFNRYAEPAFTPETRHTRPRT